MNNVNVLGRSILSNTEFQYHVMKRLWPEEEINSTFWMGGANDGKKQVFAPLGVVAGAGFQIATTVPALLKSRLHRIASDAVLERMAGWRLPGRGRDTKRK